MSREGRGRTGEWTPAPSPPARVEHYPPYVAGAAAERRWDLAFAIAREHFGDLDEAAVWMATRSIYRSEIPTDDT